MFEHYKQGAVDVVSGEGPLNHENVDAINEIAAPWLTRGQPRVVVDLERVPLLDSEGLEWLLDAQDTCMRRGGAIKIASANHLCHQILDVTGVSRRLEVFPDLTTAVGSFAQ